MVHINNEYYSVIKKNEIMLPATTWMDLGEIIIVSEISQTEKDKYCISSLICEISKIKQTSITKQRQAHIQNKLMVMKREGGGAI